jgi:hypothetical protein
MKIKKINRIVLENEVPLYDLSVPDTYNFCLKGGEVVHNSKDVSDAVAGTLFKLSNRVATYKLTNKPQTLGELKKISGTEEKKQDRPSFGDRPKSNNRPRIWRRT